MNKTFNLDVAVTRESNRIIVRLRYPGHPQIWTSTVITSDLPDMIYEFEKVFGTGVFNGAVRKYVTERVRELVYTETQAQRDLRVYALRYNVEWNNGKLQSFDRTCMVRRTYDDTGHLVKEETIE